MKNDEIILLTDDKKAQCMYQKNKKSQNMI